MVTDAEREQRRRAGERAWFGHRRRQLAALGIDVDRLDAEADE